MALVFTTFFIMGLGYVFAEESLGRIAGRTVGWIAFWIAAVGSVMAAVTILRGQSTVLYTFYPPLQAHPLFYIGATLLVVGSWMWGGVIIASYRSWRREHPRRAGAALDPRHAGDDHRLVSRDGRTRGRKWSGC